MILSERSLVRREQQVLGMTTTTIRTIDGQTLTFDFARELEQVELLTAEVVERIARAQDNGTLPSNRSVRGITINSEFNGRFSRRMGDATYSYATKHGECRYSSPLWAFADAEERRETVIHEVCHVLTFRIFGGERKIKGHGPEWKRVMRIAGAKGDRCHSVPIWACRPVKQYTCSGCGRTVTLKASHSPLASTHYCGGNFKLAAEGLRGGKTLHPQVDLVETAAPAPAPVQDPTTGTTYTGTTANRIEQFLLGHRGEWFTPNDIAKAIGKSPVTVRRYAPKLVAAGRIRETRGSGLGYSIGF